MRVISPSPHLHGPKSTEVLMRDVVIALVPAFVLTVVMGGLEALFVTLVSVASCMLFEWLINRFCFHRPNSLTDWSAVITGTLLAFNLPQNIPLWIVVIGAAVAIGIAKMSYGGIGRNIFNPALVARVFLLISFPAQMTTYPVTDAYSGATPLEFFKNTPGAAELAPDGYMVSMFLGDIPGSMGEVSALLLLLGGLYLLIRKVITWHIPVFTLGTIFVFTGILWLIDPSQYANPVFHILAGGAILGAVFMATDYVTSPMNVRGQIVYAIGIGVITVLIRVWGSYPEGMSFAILIMNAATPLINKYIHPKRFA